MHARTLLSAAAVAVFACAANTAPPRARSMSGWAATARSRRWSIRPSPTWRPTAASTSSSPMPTSPQRSLTDQICAATGGWCIYAGPDMKTVHAGMHIHSRHFNALVQDLGMALSKFKVPAKEQHELVAILAPLKGDIVQH